MDIPLQPLGNRGSLISTASSASKVNTLASLANLINDYNIKDNLPHRIRVRTHCQITPEFLVINSFLVLGVIQVIFFFSFSLSLGSSRKVQVLKEYKYWKSYTHLVYSFTFFLSHTYMNFSLQKARNLSEIYSFFKPDYR